MPTSHAYEKEYFLADSNTFEDVHQSMIKDSLCTQSGFRSFITQMLCSW